MVVVDANVHLVSDNRSRYPRTSLWPSDWPADASLTAECYLDAMGRAAIDQGVLVGTIGAHGSDNSYAADSARRYPARFASVANVDVQCPGAADTLSYWIEERGMHGARLLAGSTSDAREWLLDPATWPVWDRAVSLGIPVSAQRTRVATIPVLRKVLERTPDVTCVVYSAADPSLDAAHEREVEAVLSLAAFPRVFMLVSIENVRKVEQAGGSAAGFFEQLAERYGPGRILWGSYSMFEGARESAAGMTLPAVVARVRRAFAFLGDADLEEVMGGTARRVYPWLRCRA